MPDLDFTFLEMNPFTLVDGKPYPLDMRGELDDTAAFKNFKKCVIFLFSIGLFKPNNLLELLLLILSFPFSLFDILFVVAGGATLNFQCHLEES